MKTTLIALTTALAVCFGFAASLQAGTKAKKKKMYKIETKALSLKKGQKGAAAFHIKLKTGAKIHPQAPFRCKVSVSKGLTSAKAKLGHKDTKTSKDKRDVAVPVQVTATKAGAQKVNFDCSFFVCTKDICARKVEKISLAAKVK